MSRKDYELIAGVISAHRTETAQIQADIPARTQADRALRLAVAMAVTSLTNELAEALAKDNPRFNRDRFLAAAQSEQRKAVQS